MMKVAVIGLGHGRNHIASYKKLPDVEVAIVCDISSERLKDVMQEFGIPEGTTEIGDIVRREDISLVSVCTPDHLHYGHAKPLLQAGKHLLIEKPMTTSLEHALELVEIAERNGCIVMVGNVMRFVPSFNAAKQFVSEGRLGTLHYADGTYLHDVSSMRHVLKATPWRVGKLDGVAQEIFFGGGVHPVDLLRWIAGEVDEVFAYANRTGNLPEFPLPDQVVALMKFRSGAIGKVWVNVGIQGGWGITLTLCGSRGTIKVESDFWDIYIDEGLPGRPIGKAGYVRMPFQATGKPIDEEIAHFVDCVRSGERPLIDAIDGAKTVAVLEAVVKSYQSGSPHRVSSC
jgi:predicted dehydrogenase